MRTFHTCTKHDLLILNMWFKQLVGFNEADPEQVRQKLQIEGEQLISNVNRESIRIGTLEVPLLSELRGRHKISEISEGSLKVSEDVGDVQQLHALSINDGAIFQAASQFNLLEMVGPHVTPEQGVDGYESDLTQGPACAVACGAGTIYRNYFVPVNGQIGQTHDNQIDCLADLGRYFKNDELLLWKMQNGYAMANQEGLLYINKQLAQLDSGNYEKVKGLLRVGIQRDTEVTFRNSGNIVTQVYCSALPVAYCHIEAIYWERFARLILEATYESTFFAALENYHRTGNNMLYLTLVGGGAFGNENYWIIQSLKKVIDQFKKAPLDVRIVSYGRSNSALRTLLH